MEKHVCKYHPAVASRWQCNHCHIAFCHDCVTGGGMSETPNCAICEQALQPVSIENSVEPFWQRLAVFFLLNA